VVLEATSGMEQAITAALSQAGIAIVESNVLKFDAVSTIDGLLNQTASLAVLAMVVAATETNPA
jgi:3-oxoacyl-(acyl-carrier-protein) synthase